MSVGYEFKKEENDLIGSLAVKMGFVGLFAIFIGILYILSALSVMAIIFQDKLPAEVAQQIPAEVQAKIPGTNFLWGVVLQTATAGLIMLMIGIWTRTAASSFAYIVATAGRDISHLMAALTALYKMYSLIFTLIMLTLIFSLIGLGMQLFLKYGQ